MKRFILEQTESEFYTSHSGLALVGLCLNRYGMLNPLLEKVSFPTQTCRSEPKFSAN